MNDPEFFAETMEMMNDPAVMKKVRMIKHSSTFLWRNLFDGVVYFLYGTLLYFQIPHKAVLQRHSVAHVRIGRAQAFL